MPTIILAPSAALAQTLNPHITIEAEYGSVVAEGSLYTAAHHQPRMLLDPAPCNDDGIPVCPADGIILVSHLDLDTVGGCLRALGDTTLFTERNQTFWDLAEYVDLKGPHKLGSSGASQADLDRLYAYWAWHRAHTPRFPRDATSDVTAAVLAAGEALSLILAGDESLLDAGRAFWEAGEALNRTTFRRITSDGIIVRVTGRAFCNHIYNTPDGVVGKAIVSLTQADGSIRVSLADPIEGVSCRDLVQALWGPEAGGHAGIAGSPRELVMTEEDMEAAVSALSESIGT